VRDSEAAREALQAKLVQVAQQVKEDTELKEKYQTSLIEEISELKSEIEQMKQQMARREQEHIDEMATHKKRLAAEMERQRKEFDHKTTELELTLRQCQQTIVKLEGTVLQLNTHLIEKRDVEKQRDTWKAHHDSMEASKKDLQVQLEGASSYIA